MVRRWTLAGADDADDDDDGDGDDEDGVLAIAGSSNRRRFHVVARAAVASSSSPRYRYQLSLCIAAEETRYPHKSATHIDEMYFNFAHTARTVNVPRVNSNIKNNAACTRGSSSSP